jgi:hypothetical protein
MKNGNSYTIKLAPFGRAFIIKHKSTPRSAGQFVGAAFQPRSSWLESAIVVAGKPLPLDNLLIKLIKKWKFLYYQVILGYSIVKQHNLAFYEFIKLELIIINLTIIRKKNI